MRIFKLTDLQALCNVSFFAHGSIAGIPTRFKVSAKRADFNRTSNGLSQPKLGERLISNNHGFNVSSINMSKPYNSERKTVCKIHSTLCTDLLYILHIPKQLLKYGTNIRLADAIDCVQDRIDLTTTSSMDDINAAVS